MPIYKLGDKVPKIHPSCFIADNATIIGDVEIGENSSVWFNVVIRGDNNKISIGKNTNIQDATVIHADPHRPVTIGDNVTVGHMVMIHGCTIESNAMIGLRSTVMNGSVIPQGCLVAAGALVGENKSFEKNSLLLGMPAKAAKQMDEETIKRLMWPAQHYVKNRERFATTLVEVTREEATAKE